jgi:hypothetical protein
MKELMARKNQCEKDILALHDNLKEIEKEIELKKKIDLDSLSGGTIVELSSGVRALVSNNGHGNTYGFNRGKQLTLLTGCNNCLYPSFGPIRVEAFGNIVRVIGNIGEYIRNL